LLLRSRSFLIAASNLLERSTILLLGFHILPRRSGNLLLWSSTLLDATSQSRRSSSSFLGAMAL
jgi:hypothetical protein